MAKIVFVQNQWTEYLGVMYISAVLKKNGHSTDVLISSSAKKIIRELSTLKPDIVAFPVITGFHRWSEATASEIKKKLNVLCVFGGPHPTYFPECIESPGVDVICMGEGEYPLLDLADAVDKKKDFTNIENLWVKKDGTIHKNIIRPLTQNLDELPFPDRKLYSKYFFFRMDTIKVLIASRGCPYNCSYCYNEKLRQMYKDKGRYLRRRSPQNVIDEINTLKTKRLKTICFMDDTFTHDKDWLREFLPLYKTSVNLPFICLGTADRINDEEMLRLFKDSGCYGIYFGIESGNEEIRMKVLRKKITNAQILTAAKLLKKYGLKFRTYNMVGLPGETLKNVYETIQLNIDAGTDFPFCSIYMPYWKTSLCDYAVEKGYLEKKDNLDDFYSSYYGYSMLKLPNIGEITNLQRFFQTAVILPWTFPIVKQLSKLPDNVLYKLWFGIVLFSVISMSERRPAYWTFLYGLKNISMLFERKR